MERRIKQNFVPLWPKVIVCGLPIAMLVIALPFIFYFEYGEHNPLHLIIKTGAMALSLLSMLTLVAFVLSGFGRKWFATDDGLKFVSLVGGSTVIPWEQIYYFSNTARGCSIRWETPSANGGGQPADNRITFYPAKSDVEPLLAAWKEKSHVSKQESKAHLRRAQSKDFKKLKQVTSLCIAMGLAFVGWGVIMVARDFSSASWPSVDGKIVSQYQEILPQHPRHSWREARLRLVYEYHVAGQTYQSDRYSRWRHNYTDNLKMMPATADQYQPKTTVKVFYNPSKASEAVLVPGPDWRGFKACMVFGLFVIAVALLGRTRALAQQRKARSA